MKSEKGDNTIVDLGEMIQKQQIMGDYTQRAPTGSRGFLSPGNFFTMLLFQYYIMIIIMI